MKPRKLALRLSGTVTHYRNIIDGLGDYLQYHPEWSLLWERGKFFWDDAGVWDSGADAVICGALSDRDLDRMEAFPGPVVCVSNRDRESRIHSVVSDDREAGRVAARHFLGLGFRKLVFAGEAGTFFFSRERLAGFREEIDATPGAGLLVPSPPPYEACDTWLQRLLGEVQPPFAIYCDTDMPAIHIAGAAERVGLRIPEDAALLGTDNHLLLCRFCRPRLSSVELNGPEIGRRAGRLITELVDQPGCAPLRIEIPPLGVVARRSTDITAVEDRRLARALERIRSTRGVGVTVENLAREIGVSRRLLELRFKEDLGRTPYQEIVRSQIEYARELLLRTAWPIGRIAETTGFGQIRSFNAAFKRETGRTPREYRDRA